MCLENWTKGKLRDLPSLGSLSVVSVFVGFIEACFRLGYNELQGVSTCSKVFFIKGLYVKGLCVSKVLVDFFMSC